MLGAAAGLALVWVVGAVALLLPGQTGVRRAAQRSQILRRLNDTVPPRRLLNALARIDPIPSIIAPGPAPEPPDPSLIGNARIRAAAESVVRVLGTACGLGLEGTGWIARPGVVVTAAHVVAGENDTVVQALGSNDTLPARAIAFDARNDVAVLRVEGLDVPPPRSAKHAPGRRPSCSATPATGRSPRRRFGSAARASS